MHGSLGSLPLTSGARRFSRGPSPLSPTWLEPFLGRGPSGSSHTIRWISGGILVLLLLMVIDEVGRISTSRYCRDGSLGALDRSVGPIS